MAKRKTSRDLQAEKTRAHILETALRLFAERGIRGTPTRLIAKEAGVSEGLIFHHFPKKRDILKGITAMRGSFGKQAVELLLTSEGHSTKEVIGGIAKGFMEMLGTRGPEGHIFQIIVGESRQDPEIGALFHERSGRVVQAISAYLQSRVEAGELRGDLDCEAATMNLLGSFLWFSISSRHESDTAWNTAAQAYGDHTVELWLRGVLAEPGRG